jgi:hypothetical protein
MLQKQVRLVGIDDLARLYATIDICALSSLNEGTPVAVIEAMAAAKPVVATRVGGVVDLVDHERTGLLVPPQNPDALADAIIRLAAAPGERSRMGAAGRLAAVERFSPGRLVEDIDTLYTAALAQKRGRAGRLYDVASMTTWPRISGRPCASLVLTPACRVMALRLGFVGPGRIVVGASADGALWRTRSSGRRS